MTIIYIGIGIIIIAIAGIAWLLFIRLRTKKEELYSAEREELTDEELERVNGGVHQMIYPQQNLNI